jgi:hypothetical protein
MRTRARDTVAYMHRLPTRGRKSPFNPARREEGEPARRVGAKGEAVGHPGGEGWQKPDGDSQAR